SFRRQLWTIADYCGVEVLTWTILANHFHVLTRVPQTQPVSDGLINVRDYAPRLREYLIHVRRV
ncbi:MAG: hypothetical protein ABSE59_10020, partial [Opitutaceae bacterium]